MKTNALRILDAAEVVYTTREYPVNEDELDAISVARKIEADPEQVFKTLVTHDGSGNHFVFIIPGNCELHLKKAATAAGTKKIDMIPLKDLTALTGYQRGGCSPIGMKKTFPTFLDETAQLFSTIFVSPGVRGMQMEIAPDDLCRVTGAEYRDII